MNLDNLIQRLRSRSAEHQSIYDEDDDLLLEAADALVALRRERDAARANIDETVAMWNRERIRAEDAEAQVAALREAVEVAWGIIANASGGDWDHPCNHPDWKAAAERWRDAWVGIDTAPTADEGIKALREYRAALVEAREALRPLDYGPINETGTAEVVGSPMPGVVRAALARIEAVLGEE